MRTPIVLLFVSLAVAALPLLPFGPVSQDILPLGLIAAFAAFLLILSALLRRQKPTPHWIVVDGSNVLYWADNQPDLASVAAVLGDLHGNGYTPVVWFDANVGYLIGTSYLGRERLAARLGLPVRQVFVAPKGTPADPLLLEGAKALGAQVVTNDRFRDWTTSHPQLAKPGFLVTGGIHDGVTRLNFTPTTPH